MTYSGSATVCIPTLLVSTTLPSTTGGYRRLSTPAATVWIHLRRRAREHGFGDLPGHDDVGALGQRLGALAFGRGCHPYARIDGADLLEVALLDAQQDQHVQRGHARDPSVSEAASRRRCATKSRSSAARNHPACGPDALPRNAR